MAEWREFSRRRVMGHGETCFHRVADALMAWRVHRLAGIVPATTAPVTARGEYLLMLGAGATALRAPVRVSEVVDDVVDDVVDGVAGRESEPTQPSEPARIGRRIARRGFTYEVLPGHPEEGIESFVVEHDLARDEVAFVVTARSRPVRRWIRLAGPLGRAAQDVATRRYLRAAVRLAHG